MKQANVVKMRVAKEILFRHKKILTLNLNISSFVFINTKNFGTIQIFD